MSRHLSLFAQCRLEVDPPDVHDLHPVLAASAPVSWRLPLALSLGLTGLLLYALSLDLFDGPHPLASHAPVRSATHSVTLLLGPPARLPKRPEAPGGAGHRRGTGPQDPRLASRVTTPSATRDAADPASLTALPTEAKLLPSLDPASPVQAGGNGLEQGGGQDAARGPGGSPDHRVVPIRQVRLFANYFPWEVKAARKPVSVRLLIGPDGVPLSATAISGPGFLRAAAVKAALEWRFEPLAPHGIEAPLVLTITFLPYFIPASRSGPGPH